MKHTPIRLSIHYSSRGLSLRTDDVDYITKELGELEHTDKISVIVTGDIKGGAELMTTCNISEEKFSFHVSYFLKNADIVRFTKDHEDADHFDGTLTIAKGKAIITIATKTVGMGDKGGPGMLDAILEREEEGEGKEEQPAKKQEPRTKEQEDSK